MTPWTGDAGNLAERIRRFIQHSLDGTSPTESFETLALDLHRWQAAHDPVVHSLREGSITEWTHIPAVPVDLFKALPVGTLRQDESPAATFLTSGTTGAGRGAHRMRSTALYDLAALGWADRCVPGRPTGVVALLDEPQRAPESSLSHMVGLFGDASWHVVDGVVDHPSLHARLQREEEPIFLAATAFAIAAWLDTEPAPLPAQSIVMVTGGFKGRLHRLEGADLYQAIRAVLRPARLVTEYGMTELSSQLWGSPSAAYLPPPWLRVLAVDPASGTPLPPEKAGQLRFYDLANLDGSLAIETMDAGCVHRDGSVTLHGRLPGAAARGCSLTVEEAWGR